MGSFDDGGAGSAVIEVIWRGKAGVGAKGWICPVFYPEVQAQ